ncbi:hypothetical protein KEJ19_08015 [Candidatus Bathyarchaeota archaeon]|nr:hypothetical protein [Candidatus Bathyarchaeota archaeon]
MRIVHVAPFYSPVIDSVENVARKAAEYIVSKGNKVYIVTYNWLRIGSEALCLERLLLVL